MTKKKEVKPFASLDQCDDALRKIGSLQVELDAIARLALHSIDKAKAKAVELAKSPLGRRDALVARLEAHYLANVGTLESDGNRSTVLTHGSTGRKRSWSLKPAARSTWATVLRLLQQLAPQYVRTGDDEVNKQAINAAKLDSDQLAALGLKMEPSDKWWYELTK